MSPIVPFPLLRAAPPTTMFIAGPVPIFVDENRDSSPGQYEQREVPMAEQSSAVAMFRALVMMVCLIAIPLAALFGSSLPDAIKALKEGRWPTLASLSQGPAPAKSPGTAGGAAQVRARRRAGCRQCGDDGSAADPARPSRRGIAAPPRRCRPAAGRPADATPPRAGGRGSCPL